MCSFLGLVFSLLSHPDTYRWPLNGRPPLSPSALWHRLCAVHVPDPTPLHRCAHALRPGGSCLGRRADRVLLWRLELSPGTADHMCAGLASPDVPLR